MATPVGPWAQQVSFPPAALALLPAGDRQARAAAAVPRRGGL